MWLSDRILSPYEIELREFRRQGRKKFGDRLFEELCRKVVKEAEDYDEQVLVIGWGKSPHSAMLYSVSRHGATSHMLEGFAAIGNGADDATQMLLALGHNRSATIEDTLYAVAAAKFFSEWRDGVGRYTAMYVGHKRGSGDAKEKPPGHLIQSDEIKLLHELWKEYGKPRIHPDIAPKLQSIVNRLGCSLSMRSLARKLQHFTRSTS